MVEGGGLENRCAGNCTGGSNPSLSANPRYPCEYYSVLVRESERLQRLVERLLTFGRGEAGAGRYRFQQMDARGLVTAVVEDFRRHAPDWRIDLTTPETPCRMRGDREMLSLALWNLLDNGVKYAPDRRTMWVTLSENDTRASIAVRDEGPGIAGQDRRRIFRKFVRGPHGPSSSTPGSGIGLALVQQITRGHGGDIRLESVVGHGSTFTLVIPLEPTA